MRTTLYSRMKPEYKEKLSDYSKVYPVTGRLVLKQLENNVFYSGLELGTITELLCILQMYNREDNNWWSGKDLFLTENEVA